jgi:YidC/Oxa1 family membrane protein insertase
LENQRNLILAIILSAFAVFGWSFVSERYFPQPKPVVPAAAPAGAPVSAPTMPAAAPKVPSRLAVAAAIAGAPRVKIETPRVKGSINLKGARFDDLELLSHTQTIAKGSPPVRLLAPANAKGSYYAGFGWAGDAAVTPGPETIWQADAAKLTPETPVTLRWANAVGQTFMIKIAVDKDYMFTVTQSVSNGGAAPFATRPYALVSRLGKSPDLNSWTNHVGPMGVFNAKANYDIDFENLDGDEPGFFAKIFGTTAKAGENRFASKGGWIGIGDHYWLTALVPDQAATVDAGFRADSGSYQAEFGMAPLSVAAGKAASVTTRFFAGAKEVAVLGAYEKAGVPLFGKAIDWGWFEVIAKPFFYLLDWLFHLVGNFGVAIMLLTLIVRGVMFPIAQKQFASMAAMRVVQPKMKALQERYKDDKVKLQQETMALYQKEKVNPFAGCMPIVFQIPVFYALYKVLSVSIEMRHQPFFGWIKDLSAPDPAHFLNLFGLLDFTVPAFLGIGILALLLGVTMFLQFRLNPAPMDPAQQQMFAIMPWVMMFIMAPFAAGLLLYWTTTNILVIAQQKWLYSRHPVLSAAPAA